MSDLIDYLKKLPHMHNPEADFVNSEAYYPWLNSLAKSLRATKILEVGVWCGYSAVSMIRGNDVDLYVGVDNWMYPPGSLVKVRENLEFLHKDQKFHFKLITRDTGKINDLDFLTDDPKLPKFYDFIYIDGDHSHDGALRDMRTFWPILKKGGHMLVDDSLNIPEVREACHDFIHAMGMPNYDVRSLLGTWVFMKSQ